jgi:hypothetical protein
VRISERDGDNCLHNYGLERETEKKRVEVRERNRI